SLDIILFFFFQAEDGIRDRTVTGVQTCALPICRRTLYVPGACVQGDPHGSAADAGARDVQGAPALPRAAKRQLPGQYHVHERWRSEERRVGKERGAGWGRWQYRKQSEVTQVRDV